jgi:hypothetical protein
MRTLLSCDGLGPGYYLNTMYDLIAERYGKRRNRCWGSMARYTDIAVRDVTSTSGEELAFTPPVCCCLLYLPRQQLTSPLTVHPFPSFSNPWLAAL